MKKGLVLLTSILLLCGCTNAKIYEGTTEINTKYSDSIPKNDESKYLVLVNKNNEFNKNFLNDISLVTTYTIYDEEIYVEKETYNSYLELQKDLKSYGIEIGMRTAYRSIEAQQEIWDSYMMQYGEYYTKSIAAYPGYSEHHTGLAIDIVPKINGHWEPIGDEIRSLKPIYKTIHELLPNYGFILRYPLGKENITGYSYESWHIRYVGKQAARYIYDNNLTLEEYYENK